MTSAMEVTNMRTMFVCEKCKKVRTRRNMFNKKDVVYMIGFIVVLVIQALSYWRLSGCISKPDELNAKIQDGPSKSRDFASAEKADANVDTKASDAIHSSKGKVYTALMERQTNDARINGTLKPSNVIYKHQSDPVEVLKRVRRQSRRRRCKRCKLSAIRKLEEDIAKLKGEMSELADTMAKKGISDSSTNLAAVQFTGAGGTSFRRDKTDVNGFWIPSWIANSQQEAVFSDDDVNENGQVHVLKTGLYIVYSQISLHGDNKRGYQVMRKRGSTGSVTSVTFCKETSSGLAGLPSSCFTMKLCRLEEGDAVFIREMSDNSGGVYSPHSSFFGLILIGK